MEKDKGKEVQTTVEIPKIEYCLYARKSSESDERQAMSIDTQVQEMSAIAVRNNLFVKEIHRESHSAKMSGQRPIFNQLLADIREGMFSGILTWAPDRLSRNAGDLGILVDLIDQGKLQQIKTYSQSFSNNPNEKFLLMILCSQAKLENDNKILNVKRGIRAKCEMGWRPCMPPMGYYNRAMAGIKDIVVDPDRGHIITEMFQRVAERGQSGRDIKRWLDEIGFTTRSGKSVNLSEIYGMFKNTFYYGKFDYPVGSGIWYEGKHPPLVTKEIFDRVQEQLLVPPKSKWGAKKFDFKGFFKCACCGANVVAEDKYRKRRNKLPPRYHVYYHCTKQVNYKCPEPYINQDQLVKELIKYIHYTETSRPQAIKITDRLKRSMQNYQWVRDEVLLQQNIDPEKRPLKVTEYAKHVFYNGQPQEKREIVQALNKQLYLHQRTIVSSPLN